MTQRRRATVDIIEALKAAHDYLMNARNNVGISPEAALTQSQYIYFDSWIIPKLEAAIESAEGGEPVPSWERSGPGYKGQWRL
jgi:hypothetical protein